nr:hypothetical protein [Streptococcus mitis]
MCSSDLGDGGAMGGKDSQEFMALHLLVQTLTAGLDRKSVV